jgi:hypothetical protein
MGEYEMNKQQIERQQKVNHNKFCIDLEKKINQKKSEHDQKIERIMDEMHNASTSPERMVELRHEFDKSLINHEIIEMRLNYSKHNCYKRYNVKENK